MKLKSLILLGLVLAVLLLVLLYSNKIESEKEIAAQYTRELLVFDKDQVDELTIESASGKVVLRKAGEDWKIVEPIAVDAHQGAVQAVIANLARARLKRFLILDDGIEKELLQEYGLDPPHLTVTLRVKGHVLDTVLFGGMGAFGLYVYVKKVSENRIGMVELYRRTGVDKNLAKLRDKRALTFEKSKVTKLRIESRDAAIEVRKKGKEWQIVLPVEAKGDDEEIGSLLNRLTSAVEEFVDEAPKSISKYGLDPPRMRIDVTADSSKVQSLLVGARKESGYYAKNVARAAVFTLDSALVHQFERPVFDLRYKGLLEFKRKEIDRVEFTYPDRSILCVRDKSSWLAVSQEQPVNAPELEAILFNLEKLRAEKFLSPVFDGSDPYGLDRPRMRIRLWIGDGVVGDLSIGDAEGDRVYAKGSENDFVCLVDKAVAERLGVERIFARE